MAKQSAVFGLVSGRNARERMQNESNVGSE